MSGLEARPSYGTPTGPRLRLASSRNADERSRAFNAMWGMLFAAVLLAWLVSLAPLVWGGIKQSVLAPPKPTLEHCSVVAGAEQRLSCYDQAAEQAHTHPAKGGTPPQLFPPVERPRP